MIEVRELRIGNLVSMISSDNITTVKGLSDDIITVAGNIDTRTHPSNIIGTPVSKKWLLDIGFSEISKNETFCLNKSSVEITYRFNSFISIRQKIQEDSFNTCTVQSDKVNHIHQLQNLYFSLTGKEIQDLSQGE